jgi:CheY-like chemotaxis protein
MDIQLPVLDGYDATRQIKAMPDLAATPIIAVSSFAAKGDEEKASASGCDGYVTTPYSTPKLLGPIRGFLGENALTIGSGLRIRHRGVTGAPACPQYPSLAVVHERSLASTSNCRPTPGAATSSAACSRVGT